MSEASILTHVTDGVARLVLNQPSKLNAITYDMWLALAEAVSAADAEPAVRAIVVEGAGARAFSSGADISQFRAQRSAGDAARAYEAAVATGMNALAHAGKPTVALIRGLAYGGGLALAMCCDLRLAATDARLRIPAARLGIGFAFANVEQIVARIGLDAAADLLLTARTVEGREGERMGLLTKAFEPDAFEAEAAAYVGAIAANAPLTLRALKAALIECRKPPGERARASGRSRSGLHGERRLRRGPGGVSREARAAVSRRLISWPGAAVSRRLISWLRTARAGRDRRASVRGGHPAR